MLTQELVSVRCGKSSGKRRCSLLRVSGSCSAWSVRYSGSRKLCDAQSLKNLVTYPVW